MNQLFKSPRQGRQVNWEKVGCKALLVFRWVSEIVIFVAAIATIMSYLKHSL